MARLYKVLRTVAISKLNGGRIEKLDPTAILKNLKISFRHKTIQSKAKMMQGRNLLEIFI